MDNKEKCWLDLEEAVRTRDFAVMMRRYWVLFYTIWPEKRKKKAQVVTNEVINDTLTPDGVAKRCDEIGEMFKVKTE